MSYLFGIETTRPQKNVGSGILNFGPRPEKNGPKGLASETGIKHFGIWTSFIKETPAQMGCAYFLILCYFATLRAVQVLAGGPRAENQKLEF